jgi:hypothetical protein
VGGRSGVAVVAEAVTETGTRGRKVHQRDGAASAVAGAVTETDE